MSKIFAPLNAHIKPVGRICGVVRLLIIELKLVHSIVTGLALDEGGGSTFTKLLDHSIYFFTLSATIYYRAAIYIARKI